MPRPSGFAFHAAAPAGQWLNDPNALVRSGGRWQLFAQHRADAPDFRATGWARLSSPDLLRWTFEGPVLPPAGDEWMYSGSIHRDGHRLVAHHTIHAAGLERQVRRWSADDGASWSPPEPLAVLGGPAPDRRDPFVTRWHDGWRMLVAEPCGWADWRGPARSRLRLHRSDDGRSWMEAGTIGPWSPPGVMWEVPVLVRLGGHDVLILSLVDRRRDGAECSSRAWVGRLDDDGFTRHPSAPAGGQRLDMGPDFYAAMIATPDEPAGELADAPAGRSAGHALCVGWLSSWATARAVRWPGGAGGPISLPRTLSVESGPSGPTVAVRPMAELLERFTRPVASCPRAGVGWLSVPAGASRTVLTLRMADVRLTFDLGRDRLLVRRDGGGLDWSRDHPIAPSPGDDPPSLLLVVDGPVVELFLPERGLAISAALTATDGPAEVRATIDGVAHAISWRPAPCPLSDGVSRPG